jgi:hypothetical protein
MTPEQVAAEVVTRRREEATGEPGTVTLSTGVILRVSSVPNMLYTDIMAEMAPDRPKVPAIWIEARERYEENPNDPDYQERIGLWTAQAMTAVNNAFILEGTEVESLPDGFAAHDDQAFVDRMRTLRRPVANDAEKYLTWIKYRAAPDESDVVLMLQEIGRRSNVTETDVATAVENFQR